VSQQTVSAGRYHSIFSCWNIFPKIRRNNDISSQGILISCPPHKFWRLKILGPLSKFKIQQYVVKMIPSDTAETESEIAEMSSWDQGNRGEKLGLVWRNTKKIRQIFNDHLYLPFFLLIILWESPLLLSWKTAIFVPELA